MQVVLQVTGIGTGSDNWFVKDLPLFIAFAVLAAYTYSSGLRARAGLRAGPVHVPALGDRRGRHPERVGDPAQRRAAAGVLLLLGLLALLGFVAIAAGVKVTNPQQSVPQLFEDQFSPRFAGVAFAAIVIGALVPAAIMSIAAANLWTRNVYKAFINRGATHAQEATQSQVASLLVEFGALVFVLALSKDFAINLQLLGGVWILQTLPAIVIGLYPRWLHRWRCSQAGRSAWRGAPGSRTASRRRPRRTSAARW